MGLLKTEMWKVVMEQIFAGKSLAFGHINFEVLLGNRIEYQVGIMSLEVRGGIG